MKESVKEYLIWVIWFVYFWLGLMGITNYLFMIWAMFKLSPWIVWSIEMGLSVSIGLGLSIFLVLLSYPHVIPTWIKGIKTIVKGDK